MKRISESYTSISPEAIYIPQYGREFIDEYLKEQDFDFSGPIIWEVIINISPTGEDVEIDIEWMQYEEPVGILILLRSIEV